MLKGDASNLVKPLSEVSEKKERCGSPEKVRTYMIWCFIGQIHLLKSKDEVSEIYSSFWKVKNAGKHEWEKIKDGVDGQFGVPEWNK